MKKILFCILLAPLAVSAQNIITIAGNGSYTHTGDGGPATAAGLSYPISVAPDATGNVYIAESKYIRKIDSTGTITTIAGNGMGGPVVEGSPATTAPLNDIQSVATDNNGNVYLCTFNRIYKVNTAGIITTYGGGGSSSAENVPATSAWLDLLSDLFVDSAGNLYFSQSWFAKVRKINTSGIVTTVAGEGSWNFGGDGGPATAAYLNLPFGVEMDKNGAVYIADNGNQRIRKVDPSGIITTIAGNGSATTSGDGGPAITAGMNPENLVIDRVGNILFTDQNAIRKITTTGIVTTIAGDHSSTGGFAGDGGPATAAKFYRPAGMAFDKCNNLYIADRLNYRIRKILFDPLCVSVAVNDVHKDETAITLFPNPANTELHIATYGNLNSVDIYDITGRLMYHDSNTTPDRLINVSGFTPGMYLVKVNNSTTLRWQKD